MVGNFLYKAHNFSRARHAFLQYVNFRGLIRIDIAIRIEVLAPDKYLTISVTIALQLGLRSR